MPFKSTKETEKKTAADAPKKRSAAPKTAASTHKRAAVKTEPAETNQSPVAVAATPVKPAIEPTGEREQIAKLAYYLWLERGSAPGNAQDDWFRAERILRAKRAAA